MSNRSFERIFPLEDISIRADGDGRTVVAYAAMFDTPAEIHDQDGHYFETVTRTGFDKTIAERAGQIQVFYNHAKTIYGTPSERFSVPLGTPEEIRPDSRGLLTVTRYNRTPLADEILESIRNGDIRGQSFSGRFIKSNRTRSSNGAIDTIVRSEIALREYGPTPLPAYKDAAIVSVRMEEFVETLYGLNEADQKRFIELILGTGRPLDPAVRAALTGTPTAGTGDTEPPTLGDAADGTSLPDERPAERHLSGPTPTERRQRLLALKGLT